MLVITGIFVIGIILFAIFHPNNNISITERASSRDLENIHISKEGKININKANKDELIMLYGIGEVLAEEIISYREANGPFVSVEELLNVKGIGRAKLDAIIDYICIE